MTDEMIRGWACTDCIMFIANGDAPVELDEDGTQVWIDSLDLGTDGYHVVPGGEHSYEDGCRNVDEDGSWVGSTDCDCETQDFSWSSCDVCKAHLGGSRHAVTWIKH